MGRLNEGKTPGLAQLRPHHRSMAQAVAAGKRPGEVCEMFHITPAHMTRVMNTPLFEAEVARIQAQGEIEAVDVYTDLQLMTRKALEILDRDLEVEPEDMQAIKARTLQKEIAFGIMDRSGFGKQDQPVHLHKHAHLHVKDLSNEELYRDVLDLVEDNDG